MTGQTLPSAIGRYRPLAVLGAGATGTVFKAHDPLIDRLVAVKVLRTELLDADTRAEFLDRFRLEVQAAGRCAHPAIVNVYDFSTDPGTPYIVMEFVEGATLQQAIRDPARPIASSWPRVLGQVLSGLGYAHGQGITHRDIKPANIIITPAGQAKIGDFGIARLSETSLTRAGAMLGTPSYMAPEQVTEDAVDHRADLFAVGAILYEILTGRPPFAGRTMSDTILRLTGPSPADMSSVKAAGFPAHVSVLQRALAKPRTERFHSADEFAAALQAAHASRTAQAPATDPQPTIVMRPPPTVIPAGSANRWDPALLARVERALAAYLGPMARVTVAEAARQSASTEELYQALARSLQTAADRSAFLRSLGGARVEPSLTTRTRPETTSAGRTTIADPGVIPAEAVAAAQAVLAFYIGPIARMLVRQAAAQASSPRDFLERLCQQVTRPDQLAALRRRLRAEVEPKLR